MDHKKRIIDIIERHSAKQIKKPKKKNQKPEEKVLSEILKFSEKQGWYIKRFEAKAKYINGVYRSSGLDFGVPDLGGITSAGMSAWIEVKAPGRRSTLRENQYEFLREIINRGGFGVCVDSVDLLSTFYDSFIAIDILEERAKWLMDQLPSKFTKFIG